MKSSNNKNLGIFFECTMCGKCCKGFGGTYINKERIKKIATFLNITSRKFIVKYAHCSGNKTTITQQKNGYCIFWDNIKACLIHPVKPDMCKQWPFIQPVLTDVENWKIMSNSCPGIKTNLSKEQIINFVEKQIKYNKQNPQ